ncbi:hypothetical protein I8H89_05180 [Candidatus Saccharibacteria bacterium]|nr:hypothetical protein [Candidatus Saccharibacteria bacterium]
MDPNQTSQPQYSGGYPPQTPPPAPGGYPGAVPQPAPNPGYAPQPQQQNPQSTLQQPYQAPAPAPAWYAPAPKPEDSKPGDVNSYLQSAGVGTPAQQNPQSTVPGQMINGQYSIDYLDQMAAPAKQPLEKKFIFVGIGAVAALLVAAFLIFGTQKTTSTVNEVKLYTTLIDVENSTNKSSKLIKNSKLTAINSNMRTTLVNAARDMETPLTNMGQNPTSLKSAAKTGTYHDKKLVTTLEDARLNGVYDRIYANEMNTKMKLIITYMDSIKKNNTRKSMQEFITKNEPSFQTIQKSIEAHQKSPEANLY